MSKHLDTALEAIGQFQRAIEIIGPEHCDQEMIDRITTCGECRQMVEPQIEPSIGGGEVVLTGPLCPDCKAEELLWHETHCGECFRELPRKELQWGDEQYCPQCSAEYEAGESKPA